MKTLRDLSSVIKVRFKSMMVSPTYTLQSFLLLCLLTVYAPYALSAPLASPTWTVAPTTNSSTGVYTLSWVKPSDAEYVRVFEKSPTGSGFREWFSSRDADAFVKNEPGEYQYYLQSCKGVVESATVCGNQASDTITVTVGNGVRSAHEQMRQADEQSIRNTANSGTLVCPQNQQPGGPDLLVPGAWHTECQPGQGWAFYWVNSLRFPEGSELHRNIYELLGVWTTYRYFDGAYQPVWMYMPMRAKSNLLYEGPIHYQTLASNNQCSQGLLIDSDPAKCQITAGSVRVLFAGAGNNENAQVTWHLNMPGFPVVHQFTQNITPLTALATGNSAPDNHVDFQSGWWWSRPGDDLDQSFAYMVQIFKDIEFDHIIFHDTEGEPIWMSVNGAVDPNNSVSNSFSGAQLRYATTGYPPGLLNQTANLTQLSSGSISRSFNPVTQGHSRYGNLTLNIGLSEVGPAERSASVSFSDEITKVVNFYNVDYRLGDQPSDPNAENTHCEVLTGEQCQISLYWYRDDHYPTASLWVRNLNTNTLAPLRTDLPQAETGVLCSSYNNCQLFEGQYQFEMYRDSSSTSPKLAVSKVLHVVPPTQLIQAAPEPFANPNLTAPIAMARVGATTGRFEVNVGGAATYSIPILTANGSGGLQPSVNLSYNSQSGNGIVGMGWSLSAYSLISRCSQTYEQDANGSNFIPTGVQLNEQDRFCLDGQRLMLVEGSTYGANGSVYRKEIDDFTRVTAQGNLGGAPDCFLVETPDGSRAHYGNCAAAPNSSALFLSDLNAGIPYAWAQARLEDLAGNYMNYRYLAPSGGIEILLDEIEFTGNSNSGHTPFASLEFNYALKPASEREERYVAGKKVATQRRLTSIESLQGTTHLRSYHLDYNLTGDGVGRSILDSIQECHRPRSLGGVCFDKTRFTWQRAAFSSTTTPAQSTLTLPNYDLTITSTNRDQVQSGDFNGDGLDDLFYVGNNNALHVYLSTGNGGFLATPTVASNGVKHYLLTDINADGYLDVVYINDLDDHWYAHVWRNGQLSPTQRIDLGISSPFNLSSSSVINAVDYDGDGAADFIVKMGDYLALFPNEWFAANGVLSQTLGEPKTIGIDFTDTLDFGNGWQPLSDSEPEVRLDRGVRTADVNADGIVELLVLVEQEFCSTVSPTSDFYCPSFSSVGAKEKDLSGFSEDLRPYLGYTTTKSIANTRGAFADGNVWAIASLDKDTSVTTGEVIYTAKQIGGASGCVPCDSFIFASAPMITDINGDGLSDAISLGRFPTGNPFPNWGYTLNKGNGVFLTSPENTLTHDNDNKHTNFSDYNGDGYLDIWVARGDQANDRWQVHLWEWTSTGGRFNPTAIQTQARAGEIFSDLGENSLHSDQTLFMDLNGDGMADPVQLRRTNGQWRVHPALMRNTLAPSSVPFVITGIDNGLGDQDGDQQDDADGAVITIEYSRLTDSQVYERDNNSHSAWFGTGRSPVYDITSSMPVVKSVAMSSPAWNVPNTDLSGSSFASNLWEQRESYFYRGAKMQAGGRGFLGFRNFERFDEEDRLLNITRMRQDFPFTGRVHQLESWLVDIGDLPFQIADEVDRPYQPCWFDNDCLPIIPLPDPCVSVNGYGDPCVVEITPIDPNVVTGGATSAVLNPAASHMVSRMYMSWASRTSLPNQDSTHFVYNDVALDEQYELDNSLKGRLIKANHYDEPAHSFRGQLSRTAEYSYDKNEGQSEWTQFVSTVNTYHPEPNNRWVLNRIDESQRQYFRKNQLTQSRKRELDYDSQYLLRSERMSNSVDNKYVLNSWLRDAMGNIIQSTMSGSHISPNRVQRTEYDSLGRWVDRERVQVADDNGVLRFELLSQIQNRDQFGNPLTSYDQQGVLTRYYYDLMGRLYYRWTETGDWLSETMASGRGNLCPSNTAYHSIANSFAPTGPHAGRAATPEQVTCYDVVARPIATLVQNIDGGYIHQTTQYDYSGRVLAQSIPVRDGAPNANNDQQWVRARFDELGRPVLNRQPDGARTFTHYTALETNVVNPRGYTSSTATNILGEVLWTQDANAIYTTFSYDAVGNQTTIDGPLAGTIDKVTVAYDGFGNRTLMIDPDKGTRDYLVNPLGEELCSLDGRGMAIQQEYDGAGRLIRQVDRSGVFDVQSCAGHADKTTVWEYGHGAGSNHLGLLLREEDDFIQRDYIYDELGRETSVLHLFKQRGAVTILQSQTYDEFGRLFQRFDGSPDNGGIQYSYNGLGYQTTTHEVTDLSTVYRSINQLDAFGNVASETLGQNITTTRTYDARGFLRIIKSSKPSANGMLNTIMDMSMEYDLNGNLMRRTDYFSSQSEAMTYDSLDRLQFVDTTMQISNSSNTYRSMQLTYDTGGRITSKEGIAYSYDTASPIHAVKTRGSVGYFYDENGNQIQRGNRTLSYNHYDKPDYVQVGSSTSSRYRYDGLRNKLEREDETNGTISRTWYLPNLEVVIDNPLAEPGVQNYRFRRQIDGVAQVTPDNSGNDEVAYFFYDHLGSLSGVVEGNQYFYNSYDAFGKRRYTFDWSVSGFPGLNQTAAYTDHGYGNHEQREGLDLVHMGGRTYDPDVGQMMQADAVVQSPMNGQNYNRYSYVFNNPMSYTDPTGYMAYGFVDSFFSSFRSAFSSGFGVVRGDQSAARKQAENMMMSMGDMAAMGAGVSGNSLSNNLGSEFSFGSFTQSIKDGFNNGLDYVEGKVQNAANYAADELEDFNAEFDDYTQRGGAFSFILGREIQEFITVPLLEAATAVGEGDVVGVAAVAVETAFKPLRAAKKLSRLSVNCSFSPNTLVLTAAGYTAIKDVEIGDYVLAKSEDTGDIGYRTVMDTFADFHDDAMTVTFETEDGTVDTIETTPEHPFFVIGQGFIPAGQLSIGMPVETSIRSIARVVSVDRTPYDLVAYNLSVEEYHTYYVGEQGLWVHNAKCSSGIEPSPREGIYEFPDSANDGVPYVGQSSDIPQRLKQHRRSGRLTPGTENTTEVLGGKTNREVAEHNRIQELTGGVPARHSPNVSNRVDPIGPNRRELLE